MKADIIQMAHKANFEGFGNGDWVCTTEEIQSFAQLVAERCADIADTAEPYKSADLIRKHFGVEK